MALSIADLYRDINEEAQEIRLLSIEPSQDFDSPLNCSMRTTFLRDAPPYYALSYLCGDPDVTDRIMVNGVELHVTVNLIAMLRQLRAFLSHPSKSSDLIAIINGDAHAPEDPTNMEPAPTLHFWADAICMNQNNRRERAWQVKLMGEIYQNASAVIAWLGPEAEDSARAIAAVRAIAKEMPKISSQHDIDEWIKRHPTTIDFPNVWQAIDSLLRREYWKRTWIMQELVLNDHVLLLCGTSSLYIDDLYRFDTQVPRIWATDPSIPNVHVGVYIDCIVLLRHFWRGSFRDRHDSRFYPLTQARRTRATDLRDKVYGLLGVTKLDIEPDYSCPVSEVYVKTAIEMLNEEGLTLCFGEAGNALRNDRDLPSWAPDWSFEKWLGWDPERWDGVEIDSSNNRYFEVDPSNPKVLHVSGFPVANVTDLAPPLPQPSTDHDAAVCFTQFAKCALERHDSTASAVAIPVLQAILRLVLVDGNILSSDIYRPRLKVPSNEFFTLAAALLKVLCCYSGQQNDLSNRDWTKRIPEFRISVDQGFTASFCQEFLGDTSITTPWHSLEDTLSGINHGHCQYLLTRMARHLIHNNIFYTDRGLLGMGPNVQVDDTIFALKGCKMPVALRKVDSSYQLVGPTLVPGVMDGELFKDGTFDPEYHRLELH